LCVKYAVTPLNGNAGHRSQTQTVHVYGATAVVKLYIWGLMNSKIWGATVS